MRLVAGGFRTDRGDWIWLSDCLHRGVHRRCASSDDAGRLTDENRVYRYQSAQFPQSRLPLINRSLDEHAVFTSAGIRISA